MKKTTAEEEEVEVGGGQAADLKELMFSHSGRWLDELILMDSL